MFPTAAKRFLFREKNTTSVNNYEEYITSDIGRLGREKTGWRKMRMHWIHCGFYTALLAFGLRYQLKGYDLLPSSITSKSLMSSLSILNLNIVRT